ncbi:Uncharacterized protein Fot_38613 [Forsythia ovata]|uniref:Uncharacterized protein n=1 Tax=Forsythia ovata TaxID=205694 RepID=A0ABD1S2A4_9LAMI
MKDSSLLIQSWLQFSILELDDRLAIIPVMFHQKIIVAKNESVPTAKHALPFANKNGPIFKRRTPIVVGEPLAAAASFILLPSTGISSFTKQLSWLWPKCVNLEQLVLSWRHSFIRDPVQHWALWQIVVVPWDLGRMDVSCWLRRHYMFVVEWAMKFRVYVVEVGGGSLEDVPATRAHPLIYNPPGQGASDTGGRASPSKLSPYQNGKVKLKTKNILKLLRIQGLSTPLKMDTAKELIPDKKEQDEDQNGFDDVLVESDYEVDEEPIGPEVHEAVMIAEFLNLIAQDQVRSMTLFQWFLNQATTLCRPWGGFFLPGQGYVGRAFPYPATKHDKEGFLTTQPQGCIGRVFPYPTTRTSREGFPYSTSRSGRKGFLLYPTTRPIRESISPELVAN